MEESVGRWRAPLHVPKIAVLLSRKSARTIRKSARTPLFWLCNALSPAGPAANLKGIITASHFNRLEPAGQFNHQKNSPLTPSNRKQRASQFNYEPAGQFNREPAGQFNCEPAGQFNCEPAGQSKAAGGLAIELASGRDSFN